MCIWTHVQIGTERLMRIIVLNAQKTTLEELTVTWSSICALNKHEDVLGRKYICNLV